MMRSCLAVLLWLALSGATFAEERFDYTRLYGGASAASATAPGYGDGQSAWQLYAGYQWHLPKEQLGIALEAGYLASTALGWKSSWISPVVSYHLAPGIELLARGGNDFGGNLGLIGGVGVSYATERNMEVRLEYQQRAHLKGVFLTLAWHPWFYRDYADSY